MFKFFKPNNRAQVFVEYVFVIVIIVSVISAMAVYVRRALQARIRDARNSMIQAVADNYNGIPNYKISNEYEPYYSKAESTSALDSAEQTALRGGKISGLFLKDYNSMSEVQTNSEQLPPREAK